MKVIRKLLWDEWNVEHIARHDVTREEVEQACQGRLAIRETYSGRFMAIGTTKAGRILAIILHPKPETAFYVVTARTADRKERRIYQSETQEGGEQAA